MVAAMAGFAVEDVLIKQMAVRLSIGQVLVMLGAGGGVVFGVVAALRGGPVFSRAVLLRPFLLRIFCEAVGATAFVSALVLGTLSSTSAIAQATPLAVTLGAALFLGEPVGWRRWTAIGIGFVGVLLIVQPGTAGFTAGSLLAVAAVILMAVRDLSVRVLPPEVTSVQLAAWGFLALLPAGAALMLITAESPVMPATLDVARFLVAIAVGCAGYYALVAATRLGEVSAVVPFRYTRLVFALLLAYFVFGERPAAPMLVGAALIVGTGLYTIWRGALASRQRRE